VPVQTLDLSSTPQLLFDPKWRSLGHPSSPPRAVSAVPRDGPDDNGSHGSPQLVESVRVDGRPRQRAVATAGRLDALAVGGLDRRVQNRAPCSPRLQVAEAHSAIAPDAGRARGLVLVARALWERFGLGPRLRQLVPQARHTVPDEAIFAMVVNRFADPHKRGMLTWLPTAARTPGTYEGQFVLRMNTRARRWPRRTGTRGTGLGLSIGLTPGACCG
jgi:hypothetical protein